MVGILALLALIYTLTARELDQRSDHILHAEVARLEAQTMPPLPERITEAAARGGARLNFYGLLSRDGRPLAGNLHGSLGYSIGHVIELPARANRHGPIRLLAMRAPTGEIILVGRDITPLVDLRHRITEIILLSGLIIVPLILLAAFLLSIGPLRRVGRLQDVAEKIAAGDLASRMPILGRGDELDLFATTVNLMVDEVGRVVAQVKSVTDAIAHDLRTPLTRVRSQLYRASQQTDLNPALAGRLEASLEDLDSVIERFAALLRISELEASDRRSHFRTVMLDEIVTHAATLYEPLAADRDIGLSLDLQARTSIFGDEKLLFEALANLIDNAIKFSPTGGHVSIAVRQSEAVVTLEIRDNGPGVAEDLRKAVLRRFDRGDASAAIPGSGLGLSVVSAILHLHHFDLELGDAAPGLLVTVTAPAR